MKKAVKTEVTLHPLLGRGLGRLKTILFISVLFFACSIHAQEIFKKHGFEKETLTLSKGKYEEIFTNNGVVQIGSVLLNTKTNKIVRFLDEGTETSSPKAEYSSRFLTVDPLAEKYPWQSPYVFCSNNPVNRIDPDGMDDYSVNQKGEIVLIKETEDEIDKLIALGKNDKIEYDDDGNLTNASFTVNKGVLDNQKRSGETTYMSVKGNEQAKGLFEFLGNNTNVEWGRVSYGKSSNYISTQNSAFNNGIETVAYEKLLKNGNGSLIKSIDHSHPNIQGINPLPSAFPETPVSKGQTGDKDFAIWLYTYYPNIAQKIQLRVYSNNKYIRFTNKTIIK